MIDKARTAVVGASISTMTTVELWAARSYLPTICSSPGLFDEEPRKLSGNTYAVALFLPGAVMFDARLEDLSESLSVTLGPELVPSLPLSTKAMERSLFAQLSESMFDIAWSRFC